MPGHFTSPRADWVGISPIPLKRLVKSPQHILRIFRTAQVFLKTPGVVLQMNNRDARLRSMIDFED